MAQLAHLYPQSLWQWFEQICAIPHPSKHEQKLSAHIQTWSRDKGLEITEDEVGNLIIRKPATRGMENRTPVVIQAHIDMVPQKNSDKDHNFTQDPIEPWIDTDIDGDWVKARDTTLGADNGIGMASALAILGSDDIPHGPLEVLLTIDEEAGMTGAFGLKPGLLQAEILINTDSEQEGEIYMGCAGGVDTTTALPLSWQTYDGDGTAYELTISGLKGGHSGVDIHLGRGNANQLLARFLFDHGDKLQLFDFTGGSLRNAIPREGQCSFVVAQENLPALQQAIDDYQACIAAELALADPSATFTLEPTEQPKQVMTPQSQKALINLIHITPNGVVRMSDEIAGIPETSLNLGVINMDQQHATLFSLIRSQIDSGRNETVTRLRALAQLAGADFKVSGGYPGWKPDTDSSILAVVNKTYQNIYNKEPKFMVIHAGLECGLFKKPYPDLDMVSIGPTIRFPHSPDEKVEIKTVGQYWDLLVAILERVPEKQNINNV
ncbi:aminoacyl-histidine dipeptidase [Pseudomonadota bacterium]